MALDPLGHFYRVFDSPWRVFQLVFSELLLGFPLMLNFFIKSIYQMVLYQTSSNLIAERSIDSALVSLLNNRALIGFSLSFF